MAEENQNLGGLNIFGAPGGGYSFMGTTQDGTPFGATSITDTIRQQYREVPQYGPLAANLDINSDMIRDDIGTFATVNAPGMTFDTESQTFAFDGLNTGAAATLGAAGVSPYTFGFDFLQQPNIATPFNSPLDRDEQGFSPTRSMFDPNTMSIGKSSLDDEGFFGLELQFTGEGDKREPIPLGIGQALEVDMPGIEGINIDGAPTKTFDADQIVGFGLRPQLKDSPIGEAASSFMKNEFGFTAGDIVNEELIKKLNEGDVVTAADTINRAGDEIINNKLIAELRSLDDKYNFSDQVKDKIRAEYKALDSFQDKTNYLKNLEETYRLQGTIADDVYDHDRGTTVTLVSSAAQSEFRTNVRLANDAYIKKSTPRFGEDEITFPRRKGVQAIRGKLGYSSQDEFRDAMYRKIARDAESVFGSLDNMFTFMDAKDFDKMMQFIDNPSLVVDFYAEKTGETASRIEGIFGSLYTDTTDTLGSGFAKNSEEFVGYAISDIMNKSADDFRFKNIRSANRALYKKEMQDELGVLQGKLTATTLLSGAYNQDVSMDMYRDTERYVQIVNSLSFLQMSPTDRIALGSSIQKTALQGFVPMIEQINNELKTMNILSINTPEEMVPEKFRAQFNTKKQEYAKILDALNSSLAQGRQLLDPSAYTTFEQSVLDRVVGIRRNVDGTQINTGNLATSISSRLSALDASLTAGTSPAGLTFVPVGDSIEGGVNVVNNNNNNNNNNNDITTTPVTPILEQNPFGVKNTATGLIMFPTTHKQDLAKIRAAQERVTKGKRVSYKDTPESLELKKYFNDRLVVEENRRKEISDSMMVGKRKRDTNESRELKELYGLNDYLPTTTSKFTGIGTSEGISGSSGLIVGNINNTLN